ncbi:hypothetical protein HMPREF9104_02443 [Lentilactobacillus kisonensis F0435]|uniref:Uncharacterized protein n=1 Tax=Lentilactobacillus kisonensis F0435 TaxID=797516 RepID=H1LIK2_9LACO|nr:hypothetical protein HMPREF9104_02443 [Lentilactobacillus kisonensis F0435]
MYQRTATRQPYSFHYEAKQQLQTTFLTRITHFTLRGGTPFANIFSTNY